MTENQIGLRLSELREEMKERADEAAKLLRQLPKTGRNLFIRSRAESYWLGSLMTALGGESAYVTSPGTSTMMETVEALEGEEEEGEQEE